VESEDWGAWQAMATDSEINLTGLDRGVSKIPMKSGEYDFRVIAVNTAGDSFPGNVVSVVL